jgi:hypothetical protein
MQCYSLGNNNTIYIENKTSFIVIHDFKSIQNHIESMLCKMKLQCFGYNPLLQQYWGKKKMCDQVINFCIQLSNSFEKNIHVSLIMQYKRNLHKHSLSIEKNIIQYIKNI